MPTTGRCLFGAETELALAIHNPEGTRVGQEDAALRFLTKASEILSHLPSSTNHGIHLLNGALLYIDTGCHPEYSSPECTTPEDLVCQLWAGERTLLAIADALATDTGFEVSLFKHNVDYSGTGSTWGCHESYLNRCKTVEALHQNLLPHLISRIIYTGAGGFKNTGSGLTFLASPRVQHLRRVVSSSSTGARGIVHTKEESLCAKKFRRLHLICGESLCSQMAVYLKVGTTALVVAMIEAGRFPGRKLAPLNPLGAMRKFAQDPLGGTAAISRREKVTAIEIQLSILSEVEDAVGELFMPSWAPAVCRRWRSVLERLRDDPQGLADTLDWPLKLSLYQNYARRRGFDWGDFTALNRDLRGRSRPKNEDYQALRHELFEIDTRFSQLGEKGVRARLERSGQSLRYLHDDVAIENARHNPPPGSRATLRGAAVKRFAHRNRRVECSWDRVVDHANHKWLNLAEPFDTSEAWLPHRVKPRTAGPPDLRSRLESLLHLREHLLGTDPSPREPQI